MPNMSRRSLHEFDSDEDYITAHKQTNTESFLQEEDDYSTNSYNSRLKSNLNSDNFTRPRGRNLFSNNNSEDKYYSVSSRTSYVKKESIARRIFTVLRSIFITSFAWISSLCFYVFKTRYSALLWLTKKIHKASTHIRLWDTRLLQSSTTKKKLALCLIPLILLGGCWLLSGLKNVILADTKSQQTTIDSLREEINKVQLELHHLEKSHNEEITNIIAQLQAENARNNARLIYLLNKFCRHSLNQMESCNATILKNFFGAPQYLSTQKDISDWLRATFVAKHDLEMHLANVTDHLKAHYDTLIENNSKMIMDEVVSKISTELRRIENVQHQKQLQVKDIKIETLTDQRIKEIVGDALALYDADKTGLVDYALESAGGHVLSTRCTDSYQTRTAVISIFGIPLWSLWYPTNTPRTVITPGMTPGECWAFQNFPGFLVIKLATPIKIEAFSLEHISKLLAPNGRIDSAPREFSVYGLKNETDNDPLLLGKYVYSYEGAPLQYFSAEVYNLVFDLIELRIHSNHGNSNYTCLYRFRVHGSLSTEPT